MVCILENNELVIVDKVEESKIEVQEEFSNNDISKLPNTSNIYLNLFLIVLVTFVSGISLIIYSVKK